MSVPLPPERPPNLGGWTQNQVVSLLLRLAEELQQLDAELVGLEDDCVDKAEALNVASAKALLAATGKTVAEREAQALLATEDERLLSKLADVRVRAAKRKVEILRERIGIGRTVVASLRAELELEKAPWR
ncbi:hypothetical protein HGK73_29065 [Mycolicibacterium fortuitum]|nr:hypothetical protein [Mycolicibacterium fortuitum]